MIHQNELMNGQEVLAFFGKRSRQWLSDMNHRDPNFPKPVQLGSKFAVAWRRSELMAYLDSLPRQEQTGVSVVDRRIAAKRAREEASSQAEGAK